MSVPERPACQCLTIRNLWKKIRNTNLSYIIVDLNTKVKEVENEKQSLLTALKILHDDQVNEITNRSGSMAQVDHQSTG